MIAMHVSTTYVDIWTPTDRVVRNLYKCVFVRWHYTGQSIGIFHPAEATFGCHDDQEDISNLCICLGKGFIYSQLEVTHLVGLRVHAAARRHNAQCHADLLR
jgi:hypothetical protein